MNQEMIMGHKEDQDQTDPDLLVKLNIKFDNMLLMLDKKVDLADFRPVKAIVFGMVGFILLGFLSVICSLAYQSFGK